MPRGAAAVPPPRRRCRMARRACCYWGASPRPQAGPSLLCSTSQQRCSRTPCCGVLMRSSAHSVGGGVTSPRSRCACVGRVCMLLGRNAAPAIAQGEGRDPCWRPALQCAAASGQRHCNHAAVLLSPAAFLLPWLHAALLTGCEEAAAQFAEPSSPPPAERPLQEQLHVGAMVHGTPASAVNGAGAGVMSTPLPLVQAAGRCALPLVSCILFLCALFVPLSGRDGWVQRS